MVVQHRLHSLYIGGFVLYGTCCSLDAALFSLPLAETTDVVASSLEKLLNGPDASKSTWSILSHFLTCTGSGGLGCLAN